MSKKEETQKLIMRVKIDAEIINKHEWIYGYPKDEYPKLLIPRSEIKVTAEVDFFDPEFLEHILCTEEEP